MVIRVVEFSSGGEGYKIRICQIRSKYPVVIKWFRNWCFQKMSTTKNVFLNRYFSMKEKMRKIPMIFDIGNWFWKLNFGTPVLKIQTFPLSILILRQKYFWFCNPPLENPTTCITITEDISKYASYRSDFDKIEVYKIEKYAFLRHIGKLW